MLTDVAAVLGGLCLALGGVAVYRGLRRRDVVGMLDEATPTAPADVTPGEYVGVQGRVVPTEDGFSSPLAGASESVLAAWEVEQRDEIGEYDAWEPVGTGVEAVPFELDCHPGTVTVDCPSVAVGDAGDELLTAGRVVASDGISVDTVLCEFDEFQEVAYVDGDETTPERIASFTATTDSLPEHDPSIPDAVDEDGCSHGDRRFFERAVTPGEEVFVAGVASEVTSAEPDAPSLRLEPPAADDRWFVVSTQTHESLREEFAGTTRLSVGGGLVVVVVGFLLVAVGFGVPLPLP